MKKKLIIIFTICLIAILFFIFAITKTREGMSRLGCANNIKNITLCLHIYAQKYDGWFPDKNGDAGLEQLRKSLKSEIKWITKPHFFTCPSTNNGKDFKITYDYHAGYKIDSKNIGIIMDKIGNHKNFGNIGFVDGRVLPFKGKDWRKNADIPIKNQSVASPNDETTNTN